MQISMLMNSMSIFLMIKKGIVTSPITKYELFNSVHVPDCLPDTLVSNIPVRGISKMVRALINKKAHRFCFIFSCLVICF